MMRWRYAISRSAGHGVIASAATALPLPAVALVACAVGCVIGWLI